MKLGRPTRAYDDEEIEPVFKNRGSYQPPGFAGSPGFSTGSGGARTMKNATWSAPDTEPAFFVLSRWQVALGGSCMVLTVLWFTGIFTHSDPRPVPSPSVPSVASFNANGQARVPAGAERSPAEMGLAQKAVGGASPWAPEEAEEEDPEDKDFRPEDEDNDEEGEEWPDAEGEDERGEEGVGEEDEEVENKQDDDDFDDDDDDGDGTYTLTNNPKSDNQVGSYEIPSRNPEAKDSQVGQPDAGLAEGHDGRSGEDEAEEDAEQEDEDRGRGGQQAYGKTPEEQMEKDKEEENEGAEMPQKSEGEEVPQAPSNAEAEKKAEEEEQPKDQRGESPDPADGATDTGPSDSQVGGGEGGRGGRGARKAGRRGLDTCAQ